MPVILRSSGFGQSGPYTARAAFNPVGLAFGGMTYLNGFPDRPPCRDGVTAGDYSTALFNVLGIVAGLFHTCALLATGLVQCAGANNVGQLGVDSQVLETADPVTVAQIATATAMAAGGNHGCAVMAHRTIQCWGDIRSGRVNDEGVYVTVSEPHEVLPLR